MFEEHLQNQKTNASELEREHNRVRQDNVVGCRAGMITMADIRLELVKTQARNSPSFNSSLEHEEYATILRPFDVGRWVL